MPPVKLITSLEITLKPHTKTNNIVISSKVIIIEGNNISKKATRSLEKAALSPAKVTLSHAVSLASH
jgi:hypothetical protein